MTSDTTRQDPLIADQMAALQGAWRQIGLEADGVVDPPDEHSVPGALCRFEGTHFRVDAPDGTVLIEGEFEIDPASEPKRITWIDSIGADAGLRLPAIYVLDGDHFRFIAADAGQPWPTDFRTAPGLTMRTFVRHVEPSASTDT